MLAPLVALLSVLPLSQASDSAKSIPWSALRCAENGIRVPKLEEDLPDDNKYCARKEPSFLVSESCRSAEKPCRAILAARSASALTPPEFSPSANPSFQFCKAAGGTPQLIDVRIEKEWIEFDRCLFAEDGSFIDATSFFWLAKAPGATP